MSILSEFDLAAKEGPEGFQPALTFAGALAAPPPGLPLARLTALDLPVAGRAAVAGDMVTKGVIGEMPYVGEVDLVDDTLDPSNVVLLETPDGILARGSVSSARSPRVASAGARLAACGAALAAGCAAPWLIAPRPPRLRLQSKPNAGCAPPLDAKEDAPWRPFLLSFSLQRGRVRGARGRAVGAYAACASKGDVKALEAVQDANWRVKGSRGMHAVQGGQKLLVLSPVMFKEQNYFPVFKEEGAPAGRACSRVPWGARALHQAADRVHANARACQLA